MTDQEREDRIEAALGEWLELREQGAPEAADAVLARNPDLAEDLRANFAALSAADRAVAQSTADPLPFTDFRILREMGRGGMGVVYEAEQVSMRRVVALKILHPAVVLDPRAVERFRREAQAAGRIHHTNVVPVYAMGEDRGRWYYAMELVRGRTLVEVIEDLRRLGAGPPGARTPILTAGAEGTPGARDFFSRVAVAFAGVAEALHAAHVAGIVHRDVKPSNLILDDDGTLKVTDFGLARAGGDLPTMTATGALLGTPSYMSPEQARPEGRAIDARTDVWGLGATLYEILSLRRAFGGAGIPQTIEAILTKDPIALRAHNDRIPRDLETIVAKCLEKDPARRYRTALDLSRDVRAFAEGLGIRARRASVLARSWRRVKRNKLRIASAAAVLLAVALGVRSVGAERERDQEAARRLDLEYEQLLARAEGGWPSKQDHSGFHDDAVRALDRAIAILPDRPEAWFRRGLYAEASIDACLSYLDAARERGLAAITWHWARASLLWAAGRWDDSLQERRIAEALGVGGVDALTLRAVLASEGGHSEEACALLTLAIASAPAGSRGMAKALVARSETRLRLGDVAGALEDRLTRRALPTRIKSVEQSNEVAIAYLWSRLDKPEAAEGIIDDLIADCQRLGTLEAWTGLCAACRRLVPAWTLRASDQALSHFPGALEILESRLTALPPEEKIELCNWMIASDASRHAAHCHKGLTLIAIGKSEEALGVLWDAVATGPRCPCARLWTGKALWALGRPREAMAAYQECLRVSPLNSEASGDLGNLLLKEGQFKEAVSVLQDAIRADHTIGSLFRSLGLALSFSKRYDEALSAYRAGLRVSPADGQLLEGVGSALLRSGKVSEAVDVLRRACVVLPMADTESVGARVALASALELSGNWQEALEIVDAIDPPPVVSRLYFDVRAKVLLAAGRLPEALRDWEEILRRDPDSGWAHMWRATILHRLGRNADALQDYDIALALSDRPPRFFVGGQELYLEQSIAGERATLRINRGGCLHACGRSAEALLDFEEVLAGDAKNVLAWKNKGIVLQAMRRVPDSIGAFRTAASLAPSDEEVHRYLARALAENGEFEEALQEVDVALALDAGKADTWDTKALCLLERGMAEPALDAARRAAALAPGSPRFRERVGEGLLALGRCSEALGEFDAVLAASAFPNDGTVEANRAHALTGLDRLSEAADAYDRAIARGYRNPDGVINYVWSCAIADDVAPEMVGKAALVAQGIVDLDPENWRAHGALAAAYCRLADWEKAGRALVQARRTRMGESVVLLPLLRAQVQWGRGRRAEALETYRSAAPASDEKGPEEHLLRRVRRRTEEMLGIEK